MHTVGMCVGVVINMCARVCVCVCVCVYGLLSWGVSHAGCLIESRSFIHEQNHRSGISDIKEHFLFT